jgi:hypothetical protein
MEKYTLWSDQYHVWFFLVPTDVELPEGDCTIITLLGREMQVDPAALEPYVVLRELAEAYLSGQMRRGLEHVSESVLGFFKTAYYRRSQPRDKHTTGWNADFLADLFDQPADAVRHDPEATKQGLLDLFAEAAYFFDSVKSGDEARMAIARQQVAGFTDVLRRHGVQVDDAIYNLPDYLAQLYRRTPDE